MAKKKEVSAAEKSEELIAAEAELKHWEDYLETQGLTGDENSPYKTTLETLKKNVAHLAEDQLEPE
jgi:hypothetical protein